jgi:hypothetical protein
MDLSKLHPFLVQCQINFNDHPSTFADDKMKVNFTISYLKGIALTWFKPYLIILVTPLPGFLSNYLLFCQELQGNFGPLDPTGSAESEIKNLRIKDNQCISKYLIQFNCLTTEINWGNSALQHAFYRGLLDCIKDQMAQVGKPDSLLDIKNLVQSINAHYWE